MRRAPLIAALLLSGCAVNAPVSEPLQPLPPAFLEPAGVGEAPADWWIRRLQDRALARLVEAGLADAPDLAAALARVEAARAQLRSSEAERLPAVNGSAGVTYNRTSASELGFEGGGGQGDPQIDRSRILYRAGLEASWDADLFGRLRADERAARARLDAAGLEAGAVRLTLVTDIARNFVAARAAAAREAVLRRNVAAATDLLEISRTRARAGLVAGIDAVRAEGLVAETAATIPPVQAERAARIAALATLTGLPPAEIAQLVEQAPHLPRFGAPAAGVPSDLLQRRPDIAAAFARIAAADADTASAIAARYPRLSISGVIGLVATALGGLFSPDALSAAVGPGIAGPILDGGRNRARVEGARARALEAVANYRGAVLRAFGETETAIAAVEARERQRTAVQRLLAANRDAAQIARLQYRSGLTDFLGVVDAERAALRAQDQLVAVEAELADAELALFRAIGGDWPGR